MIQSSSRRNLKKVIEIYLPGKAIHLQAPANHCQSLYPQIEKTGNSGNNTWEWSTPECDDDSSTTLQKKLEKDIQRTPDIAGLVSVKFLTLYIKRIT